jgi:16S rRNA (cytidine1402-2'-O)-methyltransferase
MLTVCATPIGNLEDVTLRVLRELGEADLVLCEDTRRTRGLLERHGLRARLLSYHEHNEAARTAEVLPRLAGGARVALVSDAGLPGVSDPGARLIAAALEAGVAVSVLPGPSAIETALVASGLVGERYAFVGYLPRGERERAALWAELSGWRWPAVAFESPQRLPEALRSLAAALPERRVAVCRELTKQFEEVVRGSAAEVAERFHEAPKGEITLVVGGGRAVDSRVGGEAAAAVAVGAVAELVGAGVARGQAAELVSRLTGMSRNVLYRGSLRSPVSEV